MKTIPLNRRKGWLDRRQIPREIGPIEDTGEDPDRPQFEDYLEWGTAQPTSFVDSELIWGPFSAGLPLPGQGTTSMERPETELIPEATKANKLRKLEQLDSYLYCQSTCEHVSEMKGVALELWRARVVPDGCAKPYSAEENKLISLLLATRSLWIRPLRNWSAPTGSRLEVLMHLTDYLLAKHPAPEWLQLRNLIQPPPEDRSCFPPDPYRYHTPWEVVWPAYLASAQAFELGPVLRSCAAKCEIDLPGASARYAYDVPRTEFPTHGFQWLLVRCNGGSPELATRLAGELPAMTVEWLPSLIRLFINAQELVDHAQLIVDWILHQHTEGQRSRLPPSFNLSVDSPGQILKNALRHREYEAYLYRGFHNERNWSSHGWDASLEECDQSWDMRELVSAADLFEESKAMRHWITWHARDCSQGRMAIFSLSKEGCRRVTVVVNPATRRLVQLHGFAKRIPTRQESRLVNRWYAQVVTSRSAASAANSDSARALIGSDQ